MSKTAMLLLRRYWFPKNEDQKLLESRLSRGRNTVWWFIEVACFVGSSRFVCRQSLGFCWNDGGTGNQSLCRIPGGSCPLTINYYTCNEKEDTQILKKNYFIALLSVFEKLGKVTTSFIISVFPSAWNNSAPFRRSVMKFDIWTFF